MQGLTLFPIFMKIYDFLFDNKEISIFQVDTFKRITVILALINFILIPVDMAFTVSNQLWDFLVLVTFAFALLWTRNNFTLIGIYFIAIKFNTELLLQHWTPTSITMEFKQGLKWIGLTFSTLGTIFLLFGLWKNHKYQEGIKIKKKIILSTFINIIVITLSLQIIFHVVL